MVQAPNHIGSRLLSLKPGLNINWKWRSACGPADAKLFFAPERGDDDYSNNQVARGKATAARYEQAKEICASCPVRVECLNYAIEQPEHYGVFGGMDPEERRLERRRRSKRARKEMEALSA